MYNGTIHTHWHTVGACLSLQVVASFKFDVTSDPETRLLAEMSAVKDAAEKRTKKEKKKTREAKKKLRVRCARCHIVGIRSEVATTKTSELNPTRRHVLCWPTRPPSPSPCAQGRPAGYLPDRRRRWCGPGAWRAAVLARGRCGGQGVCVGGRGCASIVVSPPQNSCKK